MIAEPPPRTTVAKSSDRGAEEQPAAKRSTALARVYADLNEMLADVAEHEKKSVADLVEESDLRLWVLERYAKMHRSLSQKAADAEKAIAELKAKKRGR